LQRLDLLLELVDTLLQALHMRLNGRRSQRPFFGKNLPIKEPHFLDRHLSEVADVVIEAEAFNNQFGNA
jgi:hypothetical protein